VSAKAAPPPVIVGIGELLWDLLPAGKQLGGAPANFAYISSLLGNRGVVVSRLGNDDIGFEARDRCSDAGLEISHVQADDTYATGTVRVSVNRVGVPTFQFTEDVAWDHLEWNADLEKLATSANAIGFGTLAQRRDPSRSTIQRLLRTARESCLRIFDVNLRQSFYTPTILKTGFALATVTKLNDTELPIVLRAVGLPSSDDQAADCEALLDHFGLELVCLTRGQHGALLTTRERKSEHPGFRVTVADTIGAGDAFTAAMAHQLLRKAPLEEVNEFANRVGSWVATQPGAMPRPRANDSLFAVASK
jgi:fructokinase